MTSPTAHPSPLDTDAIEQRLSGITRGYVKEMGESQRGAMEMDKVCEKCGATKPSPDAGPYEMFDYCAVCSRDLCDECIAKGHCGNVPAKSGLAEDCGDDE